MLSGEVIRLVLQALSPNRKGSHRIWHALLAKPHSITIAGQE
jgi:hypothetical protein